MFAWLFQPIDAVNEGFAVQAVLDASGSPFELLKKCPPDAWKMPE